MILVFYHAVLKMKTSIFLEKRENDENTHEWITITFDKRMFCGSRSFVDFYTAACWHAMAF
jgi:hypothetical protein